MSGDETLVDLIDKETKLRDVYSLDHVKECIKKLNAFDFDEGDRDSFQKLFFDFYIAVNAESPRKGKVIHPSGLMNECARKLVYEFSDVEPTNDVVKRIDARTQRIFDTGTWWHNYLQAILYKAGILVQSEVPVRDRKRRISGHADGIIQYKGEKMLLEIKTMNSMSFSKGKIAPFDAHKYQTSVYAGVLNLEKVCFIYVAKDTSEIVVHIVDVDKRYQKLAFDKIDDVMEAVKEGTELERSCKEATSKDACNCPFRNHCFKIKE